jgi:arylformamidase
MSEVVLERFGRRFYADVSDPLSLAIPLDFDGPQPSHFGARPAHAVALASGAFIGDVRQGGSVNCETLHLTPHCNGTHTECVGHLTSDRIAVQDVLRGGLFVARVISVRPTPAHNTTEAVDPDAGPMDMIVTDAALRAALEPLSGHSDALVVRTLPNGPEKLQRRYEGDAPAPYFSATAAEGLAARGIDHLLVDVPSLDRAHDAGRLLAHRAFWGLNADHQRARDARRGHATITELAWIAPTIRDGWYLLDIQIPALLSDAAPSRPLLYPART